MNTTATAAIKPSRPTQSGEYPIFIRFYRDGKDAYSRIEGIRTKPKFWSKKKHRVTAKHPDYEWVNQRIAEEEARAQMIVRASRQKDPNGTIKDVKDVFEGKRTPGSFFEFADERLEKMYAAASAANPSWSMDTWLGQRSIVGQFREFARPDLIWSQLDSALLRSWDGQEGQQIGNSEHETERNPLDGKYCSSG
jgi:hypothetical protein